MGERSNVLAERFEKAVADLVKAVEQSTEQEWQSICGDEQWTVAATAHHVGAQWPLELEYISAAAEGRQHPSHTWDEINARNAEHAKEFSACSKGDVTSLLRSKSGEMAAYVRALSDEQLDRTDAFPLADGAQVTTAQLIEGGVLIGHAEAHLQSIRAVRTARV